MGIRGLSSYIRNNPNNFQPFSLHNTYVVIDGSNLMNYLYFNSPLLTQYNGEYLAFDILTEIFLQKLRKCAIEPVFVFDGIHEPMKLNTHLRRAQERFADCVKLQQFSTVSIDGCHPSCRLRLCPPLTFVSFIKTLDRLGVSHVTADREADQLVAAMAIRLRCPILSNDSDFYILGPYFEVVEGFCFIPIDLCEFETSAFDQIVCDRCSNNRNSRSKSTEQCFRLRVQRFCPELNVFKNLLPPLRPIFGAICDNDYIPPGYFYTTIIEKEKTQNSGRAVALPAIQSYRFYNFGQLIDMLSGFGSDVVLSVDSILKQFDFAKKDEAGRFLLTALECFSVNDILHSSMMENCFNSMFNCSTKMPTHDKSGDYCTHTCTVDPRKSQGSRMPSMYGNQALDIIRRKYSKIKSPLTSFSNKLLNFYRKSRITPFLFDSLYAHGCIFSPVIEDFRNDEAYHMCALPIRKLFYGLIFNMESSNIENLNTLPGIHDPFTKPYVNEFVRAEFPKINSRNVYITPIDRSGYFSCESHQYFLRESLDLPIPSPDDPTWLHGLTCLYLIWSRHGGNLFTSLSTSSIGLSLVVCSVVFCDLFVSTKMNYKNSIFLSNLHERIGRNFDTCVVDIESYSHMENNSGSSSQTSRIKPLNFDYLHSIVQLQHIYISLQDLTALLDSMTSQTSSSACFDLPPPQFVFPSGRLIHQLATHLSLIPEKERLKEAVIQWMPRLLNNYEDEICKPTGQYINRLSSIVLKLVEYVDNAIGVFKPDYELALWSEESQITPSRASLRRSLKSTSSGRIFKEDN